MGFSTFRLGQIHQVALRLQSPGQRPRHRREGSVGVRRREYDGHSHRSSKVTFERSPFRSPLAPSFWS